MRLTESQLRRIVRQEVQSLTETPRRMPGVEELTPQAKNSAAAAFAKKVGGSPAIWAALLDYADDYWNLRITSAAEAADMFANLEAKVTTQGGTVTTIEVKHGNNLGKRGYWDGSEWSPVGTASPNAFMPRAPEYSDPRNG